MCQAYCIHYGFNAISIMPKNLYGSGDDFGLENSHVLPAMIYKFYMTKLVTSGDVTACIKDEEKYSQIPDDILELLV